LENVNRTLGEERPKDFVDCIKWARNLFQRQFHNTIGQLLYNFPKDQITNNGDRFWSGNKRCPHVLNFNVNNPIHLDFIVAASNLFAHIYGISQTRDRQYIADVVSKVQVPAFQPKTGVTIFENDEQFKADMEEKKQKAATTNEQDEDSKINELLNLLPKHDEIRNIKIHPHEFEKDDDSNFHMDYIAATANLRAENYDIQTAERSKIKRIAGNIIPAIATTTAMVTGLVCLEVYKFIQGHKNIEPYKNAFVNLALPFFAFSEPSAPRQQKYLDKDFSLWHRFDVKGELTLEEFLEYFKKEHKLSPTMISTGLSVIYAPHFMKQASRANDMKRKISEVYESVTKTIIPPHVRALIFDIMCEDLEGNDIEDLPYIKYILPETK